MREQNKHVRVAEARESVIGYGFQFLWASRRCLNLLRPGSNLAQIVIEGLHPEDEIDLGDGSESFLGIDIAEYYGGTNVDNAERIVISQLKCGVRHPTRPWTISRLCAGRKGDAASSAIGRLASLFKTFAEARRSADWLRSHLVFQIVSNRPLAGEVRRLFDKLTRCLRAKGGSVRRFDGSFFAGCKLNAAEKKSFEKLRKATNLTTEAFCMFLSCLDLSSFDVESPVLQKLNLEHEMRRFASFGARDGVARLMELVEEGAKDSRKSPIRKALVLTCFDTSEENFFPAPSLVDLPSTTIATDDSSETVKALVERDCRRLLVHGVAGIGKSVTMQSLAGALPEGSQVIVFDCYAKGETFTPNKKRYPEAVFCTQIVNELAVRFFLDVHLIRNRATSSDLWNKLQQTINESSARLQGPGALLVLAIDAADNVAEAFQTDSSPQKENSFLPAIWGISIPDNVRLVLTCRSHRRDRLEPPPQIKQVEICGFSPGNSRDYLRAFLPKLAVAGDRFHESTNGVPRLQFYWIARLKKISPAAARDEIVKRKAFGLPKLYEDWLHSAYSPLDEKVSLKTLIAVLRAQTLPIDTSIFSKTLKLADGEGRNFVSGLVPGVIKDKKFFRFRDEDFEDFLDEQIDETDLKNAHSALADTCLLLRGKSEYTAANLGRHLYEAGRFKETLEIALDRADLDDVSDQARRLMLNLERIAFGLEAARAEGRRSSALELLYDAAVVSRQREVSRTLLANFPALTIQHGHYDSLLDLCQNGQDQTARGKLQFAIAAELSRLAENGAAAAHHLRIGEAWLEVHIAEVGKRRMRLEFDVPTSVNYALAIQRMDNGLDAGSVIRRWRAGKTRLNTVYAFFREVGRRESKAHALRLLHSCHRVSVVAAAACAGLSEAGIGIPSKDIQRVANRLAKWLERYLKERDVTKSWMAGFIEAAARARVEKGTVLQLLELSNTELKAFQSRFHPPSGLDPEWDRYLKLTVLRQTLLGEEVSIERLFESDEATAKAIRKTRSQASYEGDFVYNSVRVLGLLLPLYALRAQAVTGALTGDKAWRSLRPQLEKCFRSDDLRHIDPFCYGAAELAVEALAIARQTSATLFEEMASLAEAKLGENAYHVWLDMMRTLAEVEKWHPVVQDLADRVAKYVKTAGMLASEKARSLMACADILRGIDAVDSRTLFEKALQLSASIDRDGPYLLSCLGAMCRRGTTAAGVPDRRKLAVSYLNAINEIQPLMADQEQVPWEQFVQSLACADAKIGIFASFDFHRRGFDDLSGLTPWLVEGLFEGRQVDISHALPFLSLSPVTRKQMEIVTNGLERLASTDKATMRRLFEFFGGAILRNSAYAVRGEFCREMESFAAKHNISHPVVDDLVEAAEFYFDETNWKPPRDSSYSFLSEPASVKKKAAKRAVSSDPPVAFREILQEQAEVQGDRLHALLEVARKCQGTKRVEILDMLIEKGNDDLWNRSSLVPNLLDRLLGEWKDFPRVRNWAEANLGPYVIEDLPSLYPYETPYSKNGNQLLENLQWRELGHDALLSAVARHIHSFSSLRLFELTKLFSADVPPSECSALTQRLLDRLVKAAGVTEGNLSSSAEVAAEFIGACFSQPDNRIRWAALYAGREMLMLEDLPLRRALVAQSVRQDGLRWLARREWMLFLFWNTAKKDAKSLLPLVDDIWRNVQDAELPHAGIQYLAKAILLEIIKSFPSALTPKQIFHLEIVNEPRQCLVLKDEWNAGFGRSAKRNDWRFSFDHTDIFPYWYSPLSHCFALHRCDVASLAEPWIVDKWGLSRDDCFKKDDAPRNESNWRISSHDHGSHPTIERLDFHVQRHGMMMAAGELIRDNPIIPTKNDEETQWHYWIRNHAFDADPCISSDVRGPVPLEPQLHGIIGAKFNDPDELTYDTLWNIIGDSILTNDFVICAASYEISLNDFSVNVYVESALVNPESAMALLSALRSENDGPEMPVPAIGVSWRQNLDEIESAARRRLERIEDEEGVIRNAGFEFEPLCVNFHSERGMHRSDSRWPSFARSWWTISPIAIEALSLKSNETGTCYHDKAGEPVVKSEVWEESENRDSYDRSHSSGCRLKIRKATLLPLLNSKNRDLVVRVRVRKYVSERRRAAEQEYDYGQKRCFLIRRDGKRERLE